MNKEKIEIKGTRYPLIDQIRGFAVLLMVIFHFSFDLALFQWVQIDFQKDLFWWGLPRLIVFLFLFSMGLSTPLSQGREINFKFLKKRLFKLVSFAIIISAGTYFMFRSRWIYFGTLHCIAVASIFILPFRNRPILSLVLGSAIVLASVFLKLNIPWIELDHKSMDYIPLFPWVGIVMWGVFASHKNLHHFEFKENKFLLFLEWQGKHSLNIYILHQPIMYSILYMLYLVLR
ncbi:MAG: DUF1624 domain-containing protein [Bacteriovoracaceae bacterium]|jgi:uncharacterized membrane protein|nr:DUF1624 domain-containing protein [Bacteriovoracaceae bacterium]